MGFVRTVGFLLFVAAGCLQAAGQRTAAAGGPSSRPAQVRDFLERVLRVDPGAVTRDSDGEVTGVRVNYEVKASDWELSLLAELPRLSELRLFLGGDGGLTADRLRFARTLPRLERLSLRCSSSLDDRGIQEIARIKTLKALDLTGVRVSDAGVLILAKLDALEVLSLSHTDISDAALPHIARLKRLQLLDIRGTRITGPALMTLRTLRELRVLYLPDSIPDRTLAELRQALPETDIRQQRSAHGHQAPDTLAD